MVTSQVYRPLACCAPSSQSGAYIYAIKPVLDNNIAAITSADELLIIDGSQIQTSQPNFFQNVPEGLTALLAVENGRSILCSGKDGTVSNFDLRTYQRVAKFDIGRAVTALAACNNDVAVGTELAHQQAIVSIWYAGIIPVCHQGQPSHRIPTVLGERLTLRIDRDRRQNAMRWQNAENHDDITALDFHPTQSQMVLSGGDDGLVSIFDTTVAEEDDSLAQAINHGPIHKAGFLNDTILYALSSDQNLAFHPVWNEDNREDLSSVLLGDLRPFIPCEYVVDVFQNGSDRLIATGSHSEARVDLINVSSDLHLDLNRRITLEAAHNGEIVRSIFADEHGRIFTSGEDGQIQVFASAEVKPIIKGTSKPSESKKGSDIRYRPY